MPDPVLGCLFQATNYPCNCLHMSIIYTVREECTPRWEYICKILHPLFAAVDAEIYFSAPWSQLFLPFLSLIPVRHFFCMLSKKNLYIWPIVCICCLTP
jgi:hypothetical protein